MDDRTDEFCAIQQDSEVAEIDGTLVGYTRDLVPFLCSYRIIASADLTSSRHLAISVRTGSDTRSLSMSRSVRGWKLDEAGAELLVADEIDLEWSPVTNLFPIRQLIENGKSSLTLTTAWVRADLSIERAQQRYDKVNERTARYTNLDSGFTALIRHGGDGFPLEYEGVWQQRAFRRSKR